jgi:hypothetical protein
MSYTYQYDSRVYGDVLIHREAMEQVLKGLLLLRERLDAWNKDESTLPYAREVAIKSDQGLGAVVKRILDVVQPRTRATQTLTEFATGRWRSMGESNELVIESDLTWQWTSAWQGRWRGNGRGEVRGINLVLVGLRDGFDSLGKPYPEHRIEIILERHDDRLEGSIQTMFRTEVKFVRDESARAEW